MTSATSLPLRIIRLTVTAVEDEQSEGVSPNVSVYGLPERAPDDAEPTIVSFQTHGMNADTGLAERARNLSVGDEVVIEYRSVNEDGRSINRGRGLSPS